MLTRDKNGGRVKKIWMSHRAIKLIKKKHRVYRRYRDDSRPAVVRIWKKAKAEIVRSKPKFERKLTENIKQDSISLFAYVRSKAKGKATVGSVQDKNG